MSRLCRQMDKKSTKAVENPGGNQRNWVGQSTLCKEDPALLTGQARFIDDLEPVAGLRHAAILRSPHPHAVIKRIDTSAAEALPGVFGVVSGADLESLIKPIRSVVRAPIPYVPIAVDKTRYTGEPAAVVVASNRYVAEDALELIDVDYDPLPAVADPLAAIAPGAPVLHEQHGSNIASQRSFSYGDPDSAFARAERIIEFSYRFPRYSSTPIETFGVIAHFERAPDRFTAWSNFQGPFVLHPLMSSSLGVPGNRLRLITAPASGGSFGIKQAVFAYIVLLCAVSRKLGCPVKWTEDRLEHLSGSSAASDRTGSVKAAFMNDGELIGLRYENIANVGAYVRAPEPASLYRMHSTANNCYRVQNIAIDNTLVLTNQVPSGLNRGYGGPQFFFSLERAMEIAARELDIDPAELRRRNFIHTSSFPYRCPSGSLLDSGDYDQLLDEALRRADYVALKNKREQARASGRLYGIGFAAGIETAGSNMAYVTLEQAAEERSKGDPKSGATATAVINMDPTGTVTAYICSTPNGQGHATVVAQIVADTLGLHPDAIDVVTSVDTSTSVWSITSGNYSNRFAATVTSAVALCANQVADRLKAIAASMLEVQPEQIELSGGEAIVNSSPKRAVALRRVAANAHWNAEASGGGIHETAVFSPAGLTSPDSEDRVPSSLTYGSLLDLVAVEIERETGAVRIDKYVSMHDVGNMLNPMIVEGQIRGGFAHGIGAALYESFNYDAHGNFTSGTFADYLCPTAMEMPALDIGHINTPSPMNETGAKGLGDGCSMLTPTAIANAVSDALGREDIELPLNMQRVWSLTQAAGT